MLGYQTNNLMGKVITKLIRQGKLTHLGPDFPPFYSRHSSSTPDIVLGNNKTKHNIAINPGPLTESNHIPIIITLTLKAITKKIPTMPNVKQADWNNFTEEIRREMTNNIPQEHDERGNR